MRKLFTHPIAPVYDSNSKLLILGSFPSVASRETGFFYGHKQNRFWKVIAYIFNAPIPQSIEEKRLLLLENGIAVWDVISSCSIEGSADSTIKNVEANDLNIILEDAQIKYIYVNGRTAENYYKKYEQEKAGIKAICLPSTSPANAAWSFERLCDAWKIIRENIKQ